MKKLFKYSTSRVLKFIALCAIAIGMFSCKREMLKPELLSNYEGNSYGEVFRAFWQGMNSNYLFWDKETINWDSMYRTYKPKFDSLDLTPYSDTTQNRCFQYMADMTKDLKDGQYALQLWQGGDFQFEGKLYKSYISFIPKLFRTQQVRPALPDTLFDYVIQYNYLKNFDYGVYINYNTGQPFQIITGNISKGTKKILYTSLNMFAMKEAYNYNYSSRPCRPVMKNFFDNIHKSNCDAVIIDLRNNGGGNLEDINFLVGQFTSKPFVFGYARYKSGSGRLDYTPSVPMSVTPQEGAKDFNKPIILLTDIYSGALCESVINAFKGLPGANVTLIGEHTYGTCGFMTGNDISSNGGTFNISNFATVRMSNTAAEDKDHKFNFSGIQPDIELPYDSASIQRMLSTGMDIQLEKAIQFINH
jgi:hypothetical protein